MPVCLHVGKPSWVSNIACSVHAPWWRHGQICMCVLCPEAKLPFSIQYVWMFIQWWYYSTSSFWAMVLCVHLHSVYPPPFWLPTHSPPWDRVSCHRDNLPWSRTKFMLVFVMWRDFTCLCFHDVVHSTWNLSYLFCKPGVKWRSGKMINLQAWEEI